MDVYSDLCHFLVNKLINDKKLLLVNYVLSKDRNLNVTFDLNDHTGPYMQLLGKIIFILFLKDFIQKLELLLLIIQHIISYSLKSLLAAAAFHLFQGRIY